MQLALCDLAHAVMGAPAGAVSLVLLALRLGAEIGDLGKRAVAAVLAAVKGQLRDVLGQMEHLFGRARGFLDTGIEPAPEVEQRGFRVEHGRVGEAARTVADGRAQAGTAPRGAERDATRAVLTSEEESPGVSPGSK